MALSILYTYKHVYIAYIQTHIPKNNYKQENINI